MQKTENVFSLRKMLAGLQYQFRVVSITSEGLTGDYVYSDWITTLTGQFVLLKFSLPKVTFYIQELL